MIKDTTTTYYLTDSNGRIHILSEDDYRNVLEAVRDKDKSNFLIRRMLSPGGDFFTPFCLCKHTETHERINDKELEKQYKDLVDGKITVDVYVKD